MPQAKKDYFRKEKVRASTFILGGAIEIFLGFLLPIPPIDPLFSLSLLVCGVTFVFGGTLYYLLTLIYEWGATPYDTK